MALTLVSCANPLISPAGLGPPNASTRPVNITLWHAQTDAARAQLERLASDPKPFPNVTVRAEAKGTDGDLLRHVIAAMAVNQPPDILLASSRTIAEFARRGALIPLDPFLDDPVVGLPIDEREDFVPGALETGRFAELNDRFYSFPFDQRGLVLYYNADALREAKISVPPRTWDEFGLAVRTTTQDNVRGWVMVPEATVYYAFVFSRGGAILNEKQTQVRFSEPAGLASLELIAALSRGGSAYLADNANAYKDFAQGKAAFLFGTTDEVVPLSAAVKQEGSQLQWGVTNIPQSDPDHPSTVLLGANLAIFKTTPERERAAWDFVRWLGTPEQAVNWSRAGFAIPTRLSARILLTMDPPADLPPTFLPALTYPLPMARGVPTAKDAASIDQAIMDMWTAVASGTEPNSALSRAVQRVNRVLGQTP